MTQNYSAATRLGKNLPESSFDCSASWHKDNVVWTTRPNHLPRCNDDRRIEWCYDDRDRRHDDRLESSKAAQFRRCRSDNVIRHRTDVLSKAKSCFNIFLNIPQPSCISMMFLRAIFSIFIHQTIFFHVYHLKDDIRLILRQIPE